LVFKDIAMSLQYSCDSRFSTRFKNNSLHALNYFLSSLILLCAVSLLWIFIEYIGIVSYSKNINILIKFINQIYKHSLRGKYFWNWMQNSFLWLKLISNWELNEYRYAVLSSSMKLHSNSISSDKQIVDCKWIKMIAIRNLKSYWDSFMYLQQNNHFYQHILLISVKALNSLLDWMAIEWFVPSEILINESVLMFGNLHEQNNILGK